MKLPIETTPALWGAAGGAVALAIVGFNWGGWVTGGKAETMTQTRVDEAVIGILAPQCVEKFERAGDAAAQRATITKMDSWSRGEFVEKGGWAAMSASAPSGRASAVAKACANLLVPS